jgi:hypothetical protein
VNAFNFLDGSDGIAGGVAALVALGYAACYATPTTSAGGAVAWSLLAPAWVSRLQLSAGPYLHGRFGQHHARFLIAFLVWIFTAFTIASARTGSAAGVRSTSV